MSYTYGLLASIGWFWTGAVFVALAWKWARNERRDPTRGFESGVNERKTDDHSALSKADS